MEPLSPSARRLRRQLGRELMAVRTLAGLTQRDMQNSTKLSQAGVSRLENGDAVPSNGDLTAWVEAAGAKDKLEYLLALNEVVHGAVAGVGIVRILTIVEDGEDSYVRVLTRRAELLVTGRAAVERYRVLFDELAGCALAEDGTDVTVL